MTHLYRLPSGELVNLDPDKIINAYHQKENTEYHKSFIIIYHGREEACSFGEADDIEILKKWAATFLTLATQLVPLSGGPSLVDPAWLKKSDTP